MKASEWIKENYDWDRSGRGYVRKSDGRLCFISEVCEAYAQAENERLRRLVKASERLVSSTKEVIEPYVGQAIWNEFEASVAALRSMDKGKDGV